MALTELPVEFLFQLTAEVATSSHDAIVGGPQGSRRAADIVGGSFEGPRLRGQVVPPAGDWLTVRTDGSMRLDTRLLLITDDGATILMQYRGIAVVVDGEVVIRTAPLFETGDERYEWLNRVQAVGVGTRVKNGARYDVYAVS
jgi:hypothetical protein